MNFYCAEIFFLYPIYYFRLRKVLHEIYQMHLLRGSYSFCPPICQCCHLNMVISPYTSTIKAFNQSNNVLLDCILSTLSRFSASIFISILVYSLYVSVLPGFSIRQCWYGKHFQSNDIGHRLALNLKSPCLSILSAKTTDTRSMLSSHSLLLMLMSLPSTHLSRSDAL